MYPKYLSHLKKYKVKKLVMFKEWTSSLAKKSDVLRKCSEKLCVCVCVCVYCMCAYCVCVHPKDLGRGDVEI